MTGPDLLVALGALAVITGSSPKGRQAVGRLGYRVADYRQGRRTGRLPRDTPTGRGSSARAAVDAIRGAWRRRTTTTIGPASSHAPGLRTDPTPTVPLPVPLPAPMPAPAGGRHTPARAPRAVTSRITAILDDLGGTMSDFRAIARAIEKAEEIEPQSLHGLLDVMTGLMTTVIAVSNLVGEVADYADTEMWVDLQAVGPLYELSGQMQGDTRLIRDAMGKIRSLYPAQLEAEKEAAEGDRARGNGPRPLN